MTGKGFFTSFRTRVLLLFLVSILANLVVTGGIILFLRLHTLRIQSRETTQANSENYVVYAEEILDSVGKQITLLAASSALLSEDDCCTLIKNALRENPLVDSFFVLDGDGNVLHIAQTQVSQERSSELIGNNFSTLTLFRSAMEADRIVWSDSYVSPLARNVTIGAAYHSGTHVVIAEVSLPLFIDTLKKMGSDYLTEVSIFDTSGNLLADTGNPDSWNGGSSFMIPFEDYSADSGFRAVQYSGDNKPYYIGIARSPMLGWKFISRSPASLNNPTFKAIITDILLLTGISLVVVAGITVSLLRRIAAAVDTLIGRARALSAPSADVVWTPLTINEFDELNQVLHTMDDAVKSREQELKQLNEELELRVEKRTAELKKRNSELDATVKELKRAREELSRSENLASLGRMVAGIAHELNTPIGNGMMAISTMEDEQKSFEQKMTSALKKSDLNSFLQNSRDGLAIAQRNIEKASHLVSSFKQVAADQSSNQRRTFDLQQMIADLLLTLNPTLKRSPHTLDVSIEENIEMDSYPGVLGQIITNLINNALLHAWDDGEQGTITLKGKKTSAFVQVFISDNGKGIPEEIQDRIFDPFFTTKQGEGGTGLGLRIAQNGTENILGGSLYFTSSESEGTHFLLEIPASAPMFTTEFGEE